MTSMFRRTGVWITASLVLNVFLGGLLVGTFVKHPAGFPFARGGLPPAPIFSVEAVMMSLREPIAGRRAAPSPVRPVKCAPRSASFAVPRAAPRKRWKAIPLTKLHCNRPSRRFVNATKRFKPSCTQ